MQVRLKGMESREGTSILSPCGVAAGNSRGSNSLFRTSQIHLHGITTDTLHIYLNKNKFQKVKGHKQLFNRINY